jgi:outer membrane protein, multidrug efflux system
MNKINRLAALMTAPLILVACARTPVPQLEMTDVPTDWEGAVDENAGVWPNVDWWTNFGSDELTQIIELVKANNFDYQNNLRNLEAAEIQLRQANIDLFPTPSVSVSTSSSTSRSQVGDGPTTGGGSSGPFRLSGSANYSGIIGKPLQHEQSVNSYESRIAQVSQTALNTMQTAAAAYFQLLFQRDQIKVTENNLMSARQVLDFSQAKVDAGVDIPINLLNQQISVANLENTLESQRQQEFQYRASLALLTGRGVQGFDVEGQSLADIDVPTVRPGLPSELLARRPDLVQAEINLRSAAISVDQARLSFFPSISLSGSASTSSPALVDIVSDPASTTISLTASLAQTLLDNGSRKRNVQTQRLNLETALANYRRTVISAFNDIDVQLNNIQLIKQQGEVTALSAQRAEQQFDLANLRYQQGVADYQTVLTAQDGLIQQRNNLLSNRLSQLNAIMRLYVALGGGWEAGDVLVKSPEYASTN